MSVGNLVAKIVLDDPRKIHYGSDDPVKGNIVLKYSPSNKTKVESTNPELFGPLQIVVTFHGRSKTKVYKQSGNSRQIYRGRRPLFLLATRIYDDSFRFKVNDQHSFPFELRFPEGANEDRASYWQPDGRFNFKADDPLPPSYSNSYSGFANRYDCFVEYRVGVRVAMPRLQLNILKPEKYDEPLVYYERPRLHVTIEESPQPRRGVETVKNEFLLPEADRPTGFKQKAKAAFSSDFYPTYSFDWTLKGPQHLYLGQPLAFEVYIKPREKECTAVVIPEVHLSHLNVELRTMVDVRAEKQIFSSPESRSDEVRATFKGALSDTGPFSKANDWSKTINTRPLSGIPSTFYTNNISLRYMMKVRGAFALASKMKEFEKEYTVTVHPPLTTGSLNLWQRSSSSSAAAAAIAAGSSSQQFVMDNLDAALPEYDRPPEYEQALEETGQNDGMNKNKVM